MAAIIRKIVLALIAGGLGGLTNSLAVWLCGFSGLTPALGFEMTPALTLSWLLPRIPPSAVWGLVFLIPFWKERPFARGTVLGGLLWLSMMFLVFPFKMNAGWFGLGLGIGAPPWVFVFTTIWGVTGTMFLQRVPLTVDKEAK